MLLDPTSGVNIFRICRKQNLPTKYLVSMLIQNILFPHSKFYYLYEDKIK